MSSAEDEFNTIMLDRHAAGKLRRAFTLEEYNAIVSRLEAVKEGREKPNFNDIKMLKMYSIATYPNGEKFLVKLSKKDQAAMASNGGFSNLSREDLLNAERFIPIEKLFPFMITAHLETKHGKRDTLMKRLREMKVANAGRDIDAKHVGESRNSFRARLLQTTTEISTAINESAKILPHSKRCKL